MTVKQFGNGDRQIISGRDSGLRRWEGVSGKGEGESGTRRVRRRRKIGKMEGAWAKREEERPYIDIPAHVDDVTQGGEVRARQTRRGDGRAQWANGRRPRRQARPVRGCPEGEGHMRPRTHRPIVYIFNFVENEVIVNEFESDKQ